MNTPIIFAVSKNFHPSKMSQEVCVSETSLSMSRKRRLDHLSWEEKLQRKKLKNRVAAQTSRDRKKAKMDDMDDRLRLMEVSNQKLSEEMRSLRELNERLLSENRELKESRVPSAAGGLRAPGSTNTPTPPGAALPPLQDLISQIDSDEYLNCLEQLADSLLREIDSEDIDSNPIKSESSPEERIPLPEVVGSSPEHLESNEAESLEINILRSNADTILAQHSYAHPCRKLDVEESSYNRQHQDNTTQHHIKIEEMSSTDPDTYYGTYDEENDCITVVVTSEDESVAEQVVEAEDSDNMECEDVIDLNNHLYCDGKAPNLLSPMQPSPYSSSLSLGSYKDPLSPAPTFISDFGYESVESPLSEMGSNDFQDLWSESFSELFPSLV